MKYYEHFPYIYKATLTLIQTIKLKVVECMSEFLPN